MTIYIIVRIKKNYFSQRISAHIPKRDKSRKQAKHKKSENVPNLTEIMYYILITYIPVVLHSRIVKTILPATKEITNHWLWDKRGQRLKRIFQ